jgi:uncharacterized protein DUF6113
VNRAPLRKGRSNLLQTRGPRPAAGARPLVSLPGWITDRSAPQATALVLGLFAIGFLTGGLGAFAYAIRVHGVPIGVAAALASIGAVVYAAGVWNASRSAAALPALGWVATVLIFSSERPEGDVIIAATHIGYAYLLGGLIVLGLVSAMPYERIAGAARR